MPLAPALGRLVPLCLLLLLPFGCDEPVPDGGRTADPLADDYDECSARGWYGDGVCDAGCAEPDPDCGGEECQDACGDVCDAVWSGAAAPEMPAGCAEASCDCGEAPIECPDLCQAECTGATLPDVPDGCPVFECDCDAVLSDPPEEGVQLLRARRDRCGTATPSAATRSAVDAADRRAAASAVTSAAARRRTIDIVFHVVRASNDAGDVPRSWMSRQVSVMNRSYGRSPFKFRLRTITRTTNNKWFRMKKDTGEETDAKNKLHSGTRATLNVYVTGTQDLLGWAVFPWEAGDKGKQDGIVLNYGTLPGGTNRPYNLGDTLVHEAGHWLGLLHTFQGGCDDEDGVSDTPAEADGDEIYKCTRHDTCKSDPGVDPVHNFMDYTDDACMTAFTPGQRGRMGRMTGKYRPASSSREPEPNLCGNGVCDGSESDSTCPADCGCAATDSCNGVAPFGCFCDADCAASGDCCADADTCE